MKRFALTLAASIATTLPAASALAAGDAAAGEKKITVCIACHGKNGKGTAPIYPNLCGQNEAYLADALKQYKTGARTNAVMKPMAATVADADVENLAAYYASQSCQ